MFQHKAHVPLSGTLLFVPGDRPERIGKALASGADAVAVDLEDAVTPGNKDTARELAVEALARTHRPGSGPTVVVRINAPETEWSYADVAAVNGLGGKVHGVLVPKAEDPDELRSLAGDLPLAPIIESARGVFAAAAIATLPRVSALLFGTFDLAAELGVSPSAEGRELLHARSQVVLACAAAGLPGPVDGPHPVLDDLDGLARGTAAARDLGFAGKVVLHPRQLATVREVFTPTPEEREHASAVLDAYRSGRADGTGAIRLPDGTFVDRPVVLRAARLLGVNFSEVAR